MQLPIHVCTMRMVVCLAVAFKVTDPQLYVKNLAARALYESLIAHGGGAVIAGLDTSIGRALAVQVHCN